MSTQLLVLLEELKTSKLVFVLVHLAKFKYQNAQIINIPLYLIIFERVGRKL